MGKVQRPRSKQRQSSTSSSLSHRIRKSSVKRSPGAAISLPPILLVSSDEDEDVKQSHGQSALKFLTRVATKIMDVDTETITMITQAIPLKSIEPDAGDPYLSSRSCSSLEKQQSLRKIRFSIGDGDQQSVSSDYPQDYNRGVDCSMNLSGYFSPAWSEPDKDNDEMFESTTTIRGLSFNQRSHSLSSIPIKSESQIRRTFSSLSDQQRYIPTDENDFSKSMPRVLFQRVIDEWNSW